MPNPPDQDRLDDKTKNATVVDLAAYRATVDAAKGATKYFDPAMIAKMIPFIVLGIVLWFIIFGRR